MKLYLDSSVVLRVVLSQQPILTEWGSWNVALSSQMLLVEVERTLDRLRLLQPSPSDPIQRRLDALRTIRNNVSLVPLTDSILRRAAAPMTVPVKTLDALHVATAIEANERSSGEPFLFATHDVQQARAATALGLRCIGL